jgi:hypothetical protein
MNCLSIDRLAGDVVNDPKNRQKKEKDEKRETRNEVVKEDREGKWVYGKVAYHHHCRIGI